MYDFKNKLLIAMDNGIRPTISRHSGSGGNGSNDSNLFENRLTILEQIAMYVTALPCPPLPMLIGGRYASSHDLIAVLLLAAMDRNRPDLNLIRKEKQIAVTKSLIHALEESLLGFSNNNNNNKENEKKRSSSACSTKRTNVYEVYQRFVADYIRAFEDEGTAGPGVNFLPLEHVECGDPIHKACSSWMAAQVKDDILYYYYYYYAYMHMHWLGSVHKDAH